MSAEIIDLAEHRARKRERLLKRWANDPRVLRIAELLVGESLACDDPRLKPTVNAIAGMIDRIRWEYRIRRK
jgi:hypothetical protein